MKEGLLSPGDDPQRGLGRRGQSTHLLRGLQVSQCDPAARLAVLSPLFGVKPSKIRSFTYQNKGLLQLLGLFLVRLGSLR